MILEALAFTAVVVFIGFAVGTTIGRWLFWDVL